MKVNNGNRVGPFFKYTCENDFIDKEVSKAKKNWVIIGYGEMTDVYRCRVCKQSWGASPAGHGWMAYRRLNEDFEFTNKQLALAQYNSDFNSAI